MSSNNRRDSSRRRKLDDQFADLEATMKEWEDCEKNSPTVYTPRSAQPSTPTSAGIPTLTSATAPPTSLPASSAKPAPRSVPVIPAHRAPSPDRLPDPTSRGAHAEVPPMRFRRKPSLSPIDTSPNVAGHRDIDDEGRPASPDIHWSVDRAASRAAFRASTSLQAPKEEEETLDLGDFESKGYPYSHPVHDNGYSYTPPQSSYDVDSPATRTQVRYTPTGTDISDDTNSTTSSETETRSPKPVYAPRNPSPPRLPQDGGDPEDRLEFDFRTETPRAVLDAKEAMKEREETKAAIEEMGILTQTATMIELFFHAENALAVEDVDRAEWKAREGLALAKELKDEPYIMRGDYLLEKAVTMEKMKMREAYEKAHGVTYVANGDEENEGGSENDDSDDEEIAIGWNSSSDSEDEEGYEESGSDEYSEDEFEDARVPRIDTDDSPLFEGSRGAGRGRSPTGRRQTYRYPHPGDEEEEDILFPEEQQKSRKRKSQKQKKKRSRNWGPKRQYVKANPIVLPAVYQSWEDPCSDDEEETPFFRTVNRKRRRDAYSELHFWSHLLRLKSLAYIKSRSPQVREKMLRALPRVWHVPDINVDIDRPPPATYTDSVYWCPQFTSFHSLFWPTHSASLIMQEAEDNDMEWFPKYNSTPFKPPQAEFTFRAHIPVSMMAPRSRSTEIFPEQEWEFLADDEEFEEFKEDVGDKKLDMRFLDFERSRIQQIVELKQKGLLPPREKKKKDKTPPMPTKRVTWVFDLSLVSWVRLFLTLFFWYWFCFGFWKIGLIRQIHLPVWNPFEMYKLDDDDIVIEPFRLV